MPCKGGSLPPVFDPETRHLDARPKAASWQSNRIFPRLPFLLRTMICMHGGTCHSSPFIIRPSCVRERSMKRISRLLSFDASKSADSEEDCCLLSPSEPQKLPTCIPLNGFRPKKKSGDGTLTPITAETQVITSTGNGDSAEETHDVFPNGAEETHEITKGESDGRTEVDRFPGRAEDLKTRSVKRSSSWLPDPNRRWPVQGW